MMVLRGTDLSPACSVIKNGGSHVFFFFFQKTIQFGELFPHPGVALSPSRISEAGVERLLLRSMGR
jgi:hypothetical protein